MLLDSRFCIECIRKVRTIERRVNLNADRGRLWFGRLTDYHKKEHNISSPFDLSVFEASKI